MNFFKKLFGIGTDSDTKDRRSQEEQSAKPSSAPRQPERQRVRSSQETPRTPDDRKQQPRRRNQGDRRPKRAEDNRQEPRREGRRHTNSPGNRNDSRDECERQRTPRRNQKPRREQQRPRATELSPYPLSTDPVLHDEEQDRWRSLDLRRLETKMPRVIPQLERPEGLELPEVMEKAIENSLVWVSYDEELPQPILDDKDGPIRYSNPEAQQRQPYFGEPSTIWTAMEIREGDGGRLKYSPGYRDLTPEQRQEYLDWLTTKDKDGKWGYVFLYYNGLERHLLIGDMDRAVEEILALRETFPWQHKLLDVSEYAIINCCFARQRKDLLLKLFDEGSFRGISLLQMTISYESDINLGAEDLLNIFYKLYPEARTALHHDRDRLREYVCNALNKLTLYDGLPIWRYPINEVKTKDEHRFLNDSFPEVLRGCVMPDFYSLEPFRNDVDLIFHTAFDAYSAEVKDETPSKEESEE